MNGRLSSKAWAFLFVASGAALLAATLAPLYTYALTLAAFGLVHVLTELRYVDRRFSPRIPLRLTAVWLLIIGLVVVLRVVRMTTELDPTLAGSLELMLVAALAASVIPIFRQGRWWRGALALTVAGALLLGAWVAPLATLVVLAVLHNLTPIGFLLERFDGRGRLEMLAGFALMFFIAPWLIADGTAAHNLGLHGFGQVATGPLGTGEASDHFASFVPAALRDSTLALQLFAAAAYLQCMHYAVVIGILPRLEPAQTAPGSVYVRWPSRGVWLSALALVAGVGFAVYAWSFRDARSFYALFALVHAWIEVPVLLAALAPLPESA